MAHPFAKLVDVGCCDVGCASNEGGAVAYLHRGVESRVELRVDRTGCLRLLPRWGEFDAFHKPLDFVALALPGHCGDRLNDIRIAQVVIQIDFYLRACFRGRRCVGCEDGKHRIHEFTGAGNWDDDLTELDLATITCCQLDSNYIRHYQRYFDSRGFPGIPG